ncbi:MAG: DUF2306 domain-containing protein [Gammaproteobacteria bacterium]
MNFTIQMLQHIRPDAALRRSASLWFLVTTTGHWIFLVYVIAVFGAAALEGNLALWNDRITRGHVPGDMVGNVVVASHLLFAALVLGTGPLQLIPQIRSRFPATHRWVGRICVASVAVATLAGLHMLFARDIGSWSLKTGFVMQGALICLFGVFAVRYARAGQYDRHRRWALRFFMVSSIALSYRVIFMIWVLATGGIGINLETGKGAFLDFMAIGQFFPLFCLEIYLRSKEHGSAQSRYAMAGFLTVASIATMLGVVLLTIGLWFPQGQG